MRFTNRHEWAELQNYIATVGITNFGRMHLGEIVNLELPKVGKKIKNGQEVCVLESNKAAIDFHTPLSGEIIQINEKLNKDLSSLNNAPEKEGWLFKIKVKNSKEFDALMSLEEYEKKISQ